MIDAFASRPHYLRALLPVWEALPPEHRGTLYVGGRLVGDPQATAARALPKNMTLLSAGPRVLVASQLDYQTVAARRRCVHMQHGAGQSYGGDSDPAVSRASSYAGGDNQDRTDLFLVPGPHPAQRCRARYPYIPVAEIGCPALDRWLRIDREGRARKELGAVADRALTRAAPPRPNVECTSADPPVVALAWHWENELCPETRSALPHFRSALPELISRYAVLGHGHPRARDLAQSVYEPLGIPWVDYDTVMTMASVLVVDNSSIGFEFAATGRPVVWMTPPWYRRDAIHGLRFWDEAQVQVESPDDLLGAVAEALDHPPVADLSGVYTYLCGHSAEHAVAAILALDETEADVRPLAGVTP